MTVKFIDTVGIGTGINPGPVVTAVVGGQTFLYVGNETSSDISVFSVGAGGSLTSVGTFVGPSGISFMAVATAPNGLTHLIVTGFAGMSVANFIIDAGGSLVPGAGSPNALGFRPNSVTSVVAGGTPYVFVGGDESDTVVGFRFDVLGGLVALPATAASATALTSAVVGGVPYLFSAGIDNNQVSVFAVNANGSLSAVTSVADTDAPSLKLGGAAALTTAIVGGATFLYVGGANDDGISAFRVDPGGFLTNVDNVADTADLKLDAVLSLTTATIAGKTFLFAAGQNDDGVSAFAIGADGRLTSVGNIADDGLRELDGSSGVAAVLIGGNTYLFGTGLFDNGVSAFRLEDNSGDNIYFVDSPADVVDETGGGGTDLVNASISFSLSDTVRALGDIENLTLLGTANISGAGNALVNIIVGNAGNNVLDGKALRDTLRGLGGSDTYIVDSSRDQVIEAPGRAAGVADIVKFAGTSRQIYLLPANVEKLTLTGGAATNGTGNALANVMIGNTNANIMKGGLGNDTLNGGAGNDRLYGEAGKDTLTGGAGRDLFLFTTALSARTNVDRITDFSHVNDTIRLENAFFKGMGSGALQSNYFFAGPSAHDADDRFIYNSATGALYYDSDGTGPRAQVLFAIVANHAHAGLAYNDFVLI